MFTFEPLYYHRIWGGRRLESLYARKGLPKEKNIGESWELVDRDEATSKILTGDSKGTLHDLWKKRREEVFGTRAPEKERFPLLIKLLDCSQTLSLQVHPPDKIARELSGESKTEMWYFLETSKESFIYIGLKNSTRKEIFKKALGTPDIEGCLHKVSTNVGDVAFIPSGRVHAIGGGNLILEIQENSDTTYRVDDWGRVDPESRKKRQLHVEEAMRSINFSDFSPTLSQPHAEKLVECRFFQTQRWFFECGESREKKGDGESFDFFFVVKGFLKISGKNFSEGESLLVGANEPNYLIECLSDGAEILCVRWGR